jgi:hypothetical protein
VNKTSKIIATAIETQALQDPTFAELAAIGFGKPESEVTQLDVDQVHYWNPSIRGYLWENHRKLFLGVGAFYYAPSHGRGEGCDRQIPEDEDLVRRCIQPGQVTVGLLQIADASNKVGQLAFVRRFKRATNQYVNATNFAWIALDQGLITREMLGEHLMPPALATAFNRNRLN